MSTSEVGMAKMAAGMSQPNASERAEAERVQSQINNAMAGVISDYVGGRLFSWSREGSGTVKVYPAGAPMVRDGPRGGWVDPAPLKPPPGVSTIDAMVNSQLPQPGGIVEAISKVEGAMAKLRQNREAALARGDEELLKEVDEGLAEGERVLRVLRTGKPPEAE